MVTKKLKLNWLSLLLINQPLFSIYLCRYENEGVFTKDQVAELKKTSLASLICENGDHIEHIQADVFLNARWPEQMLACAGLAAQFEMSMEPWKDTKSATASHGKQEC